MKSAIDVSISGSNYDDDDDDDDEVFMLLNTYVVIAADYNE